MVFSTLYLVSNFPLFSSSSLFSSFFSSSFPFLLFPPSSLFFPPYREEPSPAFLYIDFCFFLILWYFLHYIWFQISLFSPPFSPPPSLFFFFPPLLFFSPLIEKNHPQLGGGGGGGGISIIVVSFLRIKKLIFFWQLDSAFYIGIVVV